LYLKTNVKQVFFKVALHLFQFTKMKWLRFQNISFSPLSIIGQLCENLNEIVVEGIYYDTFEIQNKLFLVL